MKDKQIENIVRKEFDRQRKGLELIASENYVSHDVRLATGSILTNKYAEGYPGHRYYGGCQYVDEIEQLAIDRLCKLYNCDYANVQPHSGSQANRAVIESACNPGDTILSLHLDHGGHLTHGSPVSFSGKYYNIINYHTDEHGYIDYDEIEDLASIHNPKLIIAGASAYSREWDYERLQKARSLSVPAKGTSCMLMFDMAHTAGLIAAGLLKNPCDYCDIVTSTTHKTLRGPRGGIILMKHDFLDNPKGERNKKGELKRMSEVINSAVFPGNQGGPLEHVIAAKAICFQEASTPEFVEYQKQVIKNAQELAKCLYNRGFSIISGGTDNHCFLIDLRHNFPAITGKDAEMELQKVDITVNKNMIPGDTRSPFTTSGLRIGTPAITSRGITDMDKIAEWIEETLTNLNLYREGQINERQYVEGYVDIGVQVNKFATQYKLRADE